MGIKNLMKNASEGATNLIKSELEKKELERQNSQRIMSHIFVPLSIKAGGIGIIGSCVMRQRPEDGLVYFNTDESRLFELIDYSWNGPIFDVITQSQSNSNISTTTVKKGKSGKMAAGALIGTVLFPGVGTVVGAAIGAGGKSKNSTSGNNFSTGNQVTRRIEQPSIAILKLKHIGSGNVIPITIVCNSDIDAKIKCFQFKPQQTASELSKQNIDMLKGIKALKELYDMGALSEEEYEKKKSQLLSSN